MSHAIEGVNGREKVLMALFDEGWRWWVHEYDKPDEIVYRSDPFSTPGECEEDVEAKAGMFEGYRRDPAIYIHDGKWYWQYLTRDNKELEFQAGPFDDREAAGSHFDSLHDLLLCWGGPHEDDD